MSLRWRVYFLGGIFLIVIGVSIFLLWNGPAPLGKAVTSTIPVDTLVGDGLRGSSEGKVYVYGRKLIAKKNLDSGITYAYQDFLSSNRLASDGLGRVQSKIVLSPFGKSFVAESNALAKQKYTFTGKEDDGKLVYFGARYYDPRTNRFVSVDPVLGNPSYVYALDNPLKYIDPLGKDVAVVNDHNRAIFWGSEFRRTTAEPMYLISFDQHADIGLLKGSWKRYTYLAEEGRWSAFADSVSLAGWIPLLVPTDVIKPMYSWISESNAGREIPSTSSRTSRYFQEFRERYGSDLIDYTGMVPPYAGSLEALPGVDHRGQPVWIDIDLDYFNTVNGGSPSLVDAKGFAKTMLESINMKYGGPGGNQNLIAGVTIARSPEYFNVPWAAEFEEYFLQELQSYSWGDSSKVDWHVEGQNENRQAANLRNDVLGNGPGRDTAGN